MEKQKTAMLDLKEDLKEALENLNEEFSAIRDDNIKSACKSTYEITIKTIINRIDSDLLEIEKNQMRKMYNQGGKWASEICSEDFFDSEYTQRYE